MQACSRHAISGFALCQFNKGCYYLLWSFLLTSNDMCINDPLFLPTSCVHQNNEPRYHEMLLQLVEQAKHSYGKKLHLDPGRTRAVLGATLYLLIYCSRTDML